MATYSHIYTLKIITTFLTCFITIHVSSSYAQSTTFHQTDRTYGENRPKTCTYSTYTWNTQLKKAVDYKTVAKPYADLNAFEIDSATGCTLCSEDQETIRLEGIPEFKFCKILAPIIVTILKDAQEQGFPLKKVVGYRVGKTKGKADSEGKRTQYSNHAYGVAFDINPNHNGLYTNCIVWGPKCKLIKGGAWQPETPRSLSKSHFIVQSFIQNGFLWGGEIKGRQKDFMHFSPTGY